MHKSCKLSVQLAFLGTLAVSSVAQSGPFEEAVATRDRGDFSTAFTKFQTLAHAGHPAAQFELSLLYLNAKGAKQDVRKAMHWLKQSAVHGHQPAQSNLGVAFSRGRYLNQDDTKAYIWSNIAAATGDAVAISNREVAARKFSAIELERVKSLALQCSKRFSEIQILPQCL